MISRISPSEPKSNISPRAALNYRKEFLQ